jgi:hypothetical protein
MNSSPFFQYEMWSVQNELRLWTSVESSPKDWFFDYVGLKKGMVVRVVESCPE